MWRVLAIGVGLSIGTINPGDPKGWKIPVPRGGGKFDIPEQDTISPCEV
jgi:hypothetical protein